MTALFGATLLACLSVALGFEQFGVQHLLMQRQNAVSESNLLALLGRRHRRQVDCNIFPDTPQEMLECCTMPVKNESSAENQFNTEFSNEEDPFNVENIICMVEEVACRGKGFLELPQSINPKVDHAKCRADIDKDITDPKWGPTVDTAFQNCNPAVIEEMVRKGDHTCKSGCIELGLCIFRQFYLNCPEDYWNTSGGGKCEESKAYVDSCPLGPHTA